MSKTSVAEKPAQEKAPVPEEMTASTALAILQPGGMPAELAGEFAGFAGAGISDRQQDFLLPFLYIAQSNSPQLKRQQADKFIPGLEAGDIFNTATRKFWRGETGLIVVPAFYTKAEVEWIPRDAGGGGGQGYVATHDIDTSLRKDVVLGGKDRRQRMLPSGNQLVETAYHFLVTEEDCNLCVAGMSSTNLQTSRMWQTLMKEIKLRVGDGSGGSYLASAPCFARAYRLRTTYRKNDQGDWFSFMVDDVGWANANQAQNDARKAAKQFFVQATEHGVQLGRPPEGEVPDTVAATRAERAVRDEEDSQEPPI